FPALIVSVYDRKFRDALTGRAMLATVTASFIVGLSWLALGTETDLQRTLHNQIAQPLSVTHGYLLNLALWARALLLEFAPMTWVGALALFGSRRMPARKPDTRLIESVLFTSWLLPVIGIILFSHHQSRYLSLPLLPLALLGGRKLALLLR